MKKQRTGMKVLFSLIIIFIIAAAVFILYIYSGFYNISATVPHNGLTLWVVSTTMDNSVHHHAEDIKPPNLNDSSMIKIGFQHYREMCAGCHAAPGVERSEIGKGLYPHPPKLVRAVNDWSPGELFWITKYGIKMSGMPAFGPTHSDDKIWDIVAFLKQLPSMTHDQWVKMDTTIAKDED